MALHIKRLLGIPMMLCLFLDSNEGWDFRILKFLTKPCWLKMAGSLYVIHPRCGQKYRSQIFLEYLILECQESPKSCYLWTSLLSGRELLRRGVGWKVGNSQNINVWHDNWIPSKEIFKPLSILKQILQT